jgi:hypothetical protein
MEALFRAQEFGSERNSIDAMVFDDRGRLWCRVVDRAQRAHPMVMNRVPSMRPSRYCWEIFGEDGRLLGAVSVPSRFNITQITTGWVYGRLETEDGDAVVARMKLWSDSHARVRTPANIEDRATSRPDAASMP